MKITIAAVLAAFVCLACPRFAAAQNSWVEWSEHPTVGDTCGPSSSPEDEVTHQKQWNAYWKNTCWDQSQPVWFEVHPLQSATGECGIGGCFPVFQAYSGGGSSGMLWWDGTGSDFDFFFGLCRESVVHHAFFEAQAHVDTDPPCPTPPDCSNCAYQASSAAECPDDGGYFREDCQCCVTPWSPILINFTGSMTLSSAADGVPFDFLATGGTDRVAWPVKPDDAWLVLDRNGNGRIDDGRELFGNRTELADGTRAKHGFIALSEFDVNADGVIDRRDQIFSRLALWRERVRDGISQSDELIALPAAGIASLSVTARESRRVDRFGNQFRYRASVGFASGEQRFAYDVFLTHVSQALIGSAGFCPARPEKR
jgi:hypothetical protein